MTKRRSPPPPLTIDRASTEPPFQQLEALLTDHISKEMSPGDRFYSDSQIALASGLSQSTVVKVIERLEQRRLLKRSQGKGTFVESRNVNPLPRIGVIYKERVLSGDNYTRNIIFALANATNSHEFFFSYHNLETSEWSFVRSLICGARRIDRCILIAPTDDLVKEVASIPGSCATFVIVGHQDIRFACIDVDNYQASLSATSAMARSGSKAFSFVGESPHTFRHVRDRYAGYSAAIKAAGAMECPPLFFADFDERTRLIQLQDWHSSLGIHQPCIFCASRTSYQSLVLYFTKANIPLPRNDALYVFDECNDVRNQTLVIRQPLMEIGAEAWKAVTAPAIAPGIRLFEAKFSAG